MLDQIIENIIRKTRKEVIQKGMQDIPLTYIFTRNIPHSVKHFFDQEVEIWIREESDKFSSSERFNYEMPEVQMLIDKIFDTLKQTATFSPNQFNRLLERAIKLQANYLIRPQQTLTQFLFKDSSLVTTIEVYDMLKYFDKFQYYKDALTDYFNLKYMREISQNQFQELITAIDQQVYGRTPVETALQTIKTILNFINEGRPKASDSISARMLAIIFKDRNLSDFSYLVEREIKEGTKLLSLAEVEQALRSGKTMREMKQAKEGKPAPTSYKKIADIEKEKPEVAVETISVPEKEIIPEEPEDTFEDVYEEEYEEEEYEPSPPPRPEPKPEQPRFTPPPQPKPQPQQPRFTPTQPKQPQFTPPPQPKPQPQQPRFTPPQPKPQQPQFKPAQPQQVKPQPAAAKASAVDQLANIVSDKMRGEHLEDLNKLIHSRQRKKFIKKIFKKREAQYVEFVNLVNNTPTWKHASNLIDTFFYQQGLNPYSKEALEFSDLVYNRYFPKDISVNKGDEFRI